jgi:hypothetical protein
VIVCVFRCHIAELYTCLPAICSVVLHEGDFRIIRIRILSALTRICTIHRSQYCFHLSSHFDFVGYLVDIWGGPA